MDVSWGKHAQENIDAGLFQILTRGEMIPPIPHDIAAQYQAKPLPTFLLQCLVVIVLVVKTGASAGLPSNLPKTGKPTSYTPALQPNLMGISP